MKYIVISGIDGSGKTTIIKELQKALHSREKNTKYIWMRYNHYLVKALNAVARILNLSIKTSYGEKQVWEHHYYKSAAFYKIYVLASYIDNFIASFKVKKLHDGGYDYVICDRWINDIIADIGSEFRREDILDSAWYRRFQNILPENTMQFVVTRPVERLVEARENNRYDSNFPTRFNIYKKIAQTKNSVEVKNSGPINESVNFILDRI